MTDATETTPPPSTTTPPAAETPEEEVKRVAGEAQRSFSLKDRLAGVKHATRRLTVFTDTDPVERFQAIDQQMTNLEAMFDIPIPDDATAEQRQEISDRIEALRTGYGELERARDLARQEMAAASMVLHLRAVPAPVTKLARMAADQAYALGDGTVPDDKRERWDEKRNRYILGRVIEKVTTPDGELTFDRDTIAQDLEEALDLVQWARVSRAYSEIVYTDQIGEAATGDPGF